jgi:uncharacterized membrane protein
VVLASSMRRPKKITTKSRLAAAIEAIPEADRTAVIGAALVGLGGTLHVTAMVPCPVCGQKSLLAEYSHGVKRCRNCPHYETERQTAADRNESLADTRIWMQAHGKAVA